MTTDSIPIGGPNWIKSKLIYQKSGKEMKLEMEGPKWNILQLGGLSCNCTRRRERNVATGLKRPPSLPQTSYDETPRRGRKPMRRRIAVDSGSSSPSAVWRRTRRLNRASGEKPWRACAGRTDNVGINNKKSWSMTLMPLIPMQVFCLIRAQNRI